MTDVRILCTVLFCAAVVLLTLARFGKIHPSRRLILILCLPALSCIVFFWRDPYAFQGAELAPIELDWRIYLAEWWISLSHFFTRLDPVLQAVVAVDAFLALLFAVDLISLPRSRSIEAERTAPRVASLGKHHTIKVRIMNRGSRKLRFVLRDDLDVSLNAKPDPLLFQTLKPNEQMLDEYTIRPTQRGEFKLDCMHLDLRSRMGFWRKIVRTPVESTIHVYPDLRQLGEYAILARTNRLSQVGVRRIRRVGQDHDFERLRDYTLDDNYKHIDWRTTARRQKLTVKDFQSSRSQRIIFLVDCGRMMTNEAEGISLLDHSFNAMLMLSYVALTQADSVGMLCFSDKIHTYVPPKAGMSQIHRILHGCHDIFPNVVESRYEDAFQHLGRHCRKRSLVVLITNLVDEVNASQVERYLTNLVGRHLPLAVLLRDRRIFEATEPDAHGSLNMWRAAAASDILSWRLEVMADLKARGSLALDVFPEEMTAPLINQYLEIKARHLL